MWYNNYMISHTNSKITLWGIITIGVVICLLVIALLKNIDRTSLKEYQEEIVSECSDSAVRSDNEGKVWTCIRGEWIYIGTTNDYKG